MIPFSGFESLGFVATVDLSLSGAVVIAAIASS
jgi:hypothetical protein